MDATPTPRAVLVHDWLTGMRGGEKCLEVLCRRWPHAQLLTLLHKRGSVSEPIERLAPAASWLNRVPHEDYYLAVSAFAPYKRLDLALAACARLDRRLVVIGSGQDEGRLRRLAGPHAAFLGWQPDEVIRDHLRRCRALVFPGEEDF